jgi:RND superfamily putative drug exporter
MLVPALMRLLGNANWWLPGWTRRALFIREERAPEPERAPALEA